MDFKRRRTKIVCTIGPSCSDEKTLYKMICAGMDVARFNFSHGTQEEHSLRAQAVRNAAKRAGKTVGMMADTRGPEIRLGHFENGKAFLKENQIFTLTVKPILGTSEMASVTFLKLPCAVNLGSLILLDDGNLQLEVVETDSDNVITRVLNAGVISDRKKVSVPGSKIEGLPAVDDKDRDDIRFCAKLGFDFVAASFIRSAADVLDVRRVLEESDSNAAIIAKIESVYGVEALDEILKTADGLMVARGDLGVEYPPEDIPVLQKRMIAEVNKLGKPVITATQMLESMIENPRPTRAEASDVANAIFDGTDAVMLSGETASGKYPVKSIEFMSRIALRAEEVLDHNVFVSRIKAATSNVTEAVSRSVVTSAADLDASAIVTPSESGYTARMVARFRPKIPIFAVTPHLETCGKLTCVWGVETVLGPRLSAASGADKENCGDISDMAIDVLREQGIIKDGSLCVVTKGVPQGVSGTTNVMEVRTVGDVALKGAGIGQMAVSGKAVVAATGREAADKAFPGCVLVCHATDRTFMPAVKKACALIVEQGGLTSDAAIAAIHLGIPAVVGAADAIKLLKDGDVVTVDGERGIVYRGVARVK